MSSHWIIHQSDTNNFIQAIKRNPYHKQTLINVTKQFKKAKRFACEADASELLSFKMKHDGWVAKKATAIDVGLRNHV